MFSAKDVTISQFIINTDKTLHDNDIDSLLSNIDTFTIMQALLEHKKLGST